MELSPPTQVLARNLEALDGLMGGVIDSPWGEAVPLLRDHQPAAHLVSLHTDYAHYRVAQEALAGNPSTSARFGTSFDPAGGDFDWLILYLPRGRELRELLVETAMGALSAKGRLLLVGQTRSGVRSSQRTLRQYFKDVEKLDVARRCALYQATNPRPDSPKHEDRDAWMRSFDVRIQETSLTAYSLPGVFCHGRLDDGTRLLLETLNPPNRGRALDFGCGCGVIGAWLHAKAPGLAIEGVDSCAFALEAARRTLRAAGVPAEQVRASDVFSDTGGPYDLIVSNPPFHDRVDTDYRVVEKFLREAAGKLRPGGELCLVANRFLPYAEPLKTIYGKVEVLADDGRYRVYRSRKRAEKGPP